MELAQGRQASPLIPVSLLFVFAFSLFIWSWNTWPDILIDFGRELYIPWQLSLGKVLYADIAHFNGPLSQYFHALLFKWLGVSITTLFISNFTVVLVLTVIIFKIFSTFSSQINGFIVALLFLVVFSFNQYVLIGNYNFIAPYSHEITHGIFLCFVLLFVFLKHTQIKSAYGVPTMGALTGLIFLTKSEVFFAIYFAAVAGLILCSLADRKPLKGTVKILGIYSVLSTIPPFIAFILFNLTSDTSTGGMNIFTGYSSLFIQDLTSQTFYKYVGNFHVVGDSILEMVKGFFILSSMIVFLSLPIYLLDNKEKPSPSITYPFIILIFFGLLFLTRDYIEIKLIIRGFPILIVGIIIFFLARTIKHKSLDPNTIFLITFSLFSLFLLLKIIFHTRTHHYGFALAMPATITIAYFLIHHVPEKAATNRMSQQTLTTAFYALIFLFSIWHIQLSSSWFDKKSVISGTTEEPIKTGIRGLYVNAALAEIQKSSHKGETLAVFPEGVMINYLLRMENPTPFINLMPPELIMFKEQRIFKHYMDNPPDLIALVHKDTTEYGFRYFGTDYGTIFTQWIDNNYEAVSLIGDMPLKNNRFGILLYRKKT